MDNCIFCKIVSGEIPKEFTHEDDLSVAFLDIHPQAPGHQLLIPKEHHRWFFEMPDDLSKELMLRAKDISTKIKEEQSSDYVKLLIDGQDVPHVHLHLIPQKLK